MGSLRWCSCFNVQAPFPWRIRGAVATPSPPQSGHPGQGRGARKARTQVALRWTAVPTASATPQCALSPAPSGALSAELLPQITPEYLWPQ